jgi:hypothetical protein
VNAGCNAAFYPEAKDRGKNKGGGTEVSGFGTLTSKGGRSMSDILLYVNAVLSFYNN